MIAYFQTDYTLYFDDTDIELLKQKKEISFDQLQNYQDREKMIVRICPKEKVESLNRKQFRGMTIYCAEPSTAVVCIGQADVALHTFYFNEEWFNESIAILQQGRSTAVVVRWNGSGDKINLLAGGGRESASFKLLYGPTE